MIGFVTTAEIAQAIKVSVEHAFISRNLPQFWALGFMPIYTGEYAELIFIPADEQILLTPLRQNPPVTPADFPEFAQLVAMLGGLDARVNILPEDIENTITT